MEYERPWLSGKYPAPVAGSNSPVSEMVLRPTSMGFLPALNFSLTPAVPEYLHTQILESVGGGAATAGLAPPAAMPRAMRVAVNAARMRVRNMVCSWGSEPSVSPSTLLSVR